MASCACGGAKLTLPVGGTDWRTAPIERVAEWNPQVAYARALRVPFAPWTPNIRATFNDSTSPIGPFAWAAQASSPDPVRLNTVGIVDRIVFQIDCPTANAGAQLKPLSDFFFGLQSGIEATMIVDGDPRYVVSPDFTPIRSLAALINEDWPMGWVMTNTNVPKMQFNLSNVGLIVGFPVKVTVTFRLWVPNVGYAKGRQFVMMSDRQAYDGLRELGHDVGDADAYCTG